MVAIQLVGVFETEVKSYGVGVSSQYVRDGIMERACYVGVV